MTENELQTVADLIDKLDGQTLSESESFSPVGELAQWSVKLLAEVRRLREANATIREKCEQYWNEYNICDAEIHAVLALIHREAQL